MKITLTNGQAGSIIDALRMLQEGLDDRPTYEHFERIINKIEKEWTIK